MPRLVCVAFILAVLRSGVFVHALRRDVSMAAAIMQDTGATSMHRPNGSFVITPNEETKETKPPAHVTAVQLIELFKTEKVFNDQIKFLTTVANDLLTQQQPLEKRILEYLKNNPQRFINASNEWQAYKKWLSNIKDINEGSDLILEQVFGYTREPGNDTQGNEGTNLFVSYWRNQVLETTEITKLLKQNQWQNELTKILKLNQWKDAIGAPEALANAIEKYEPYYCAYLADYVDFSGFFEDRLKQLKQAGLWKAGLWKLAKEKEMSRNLDMNAWMRPVQRLPRYELIVKEIDKDKIVPHEVRDAAVAAHNRLNRVSVHVNRCQKWYGMMNRAREQWKLGQLSRAHKTARTNREKSGDKTKVNISENCHMYVGAHNVVVLSQEPTSKGRKWKERTLHICTNALFIEKATGLYKPSPQIIRLNKVDSVTTTTCQESNKGESVTAETCFHIFAKRQAGAELEETVIKGLQNVSLVAIKEKFDAMSRRKKLLRDNLKDLLKVKVANASTKPDS